MGPDCWPTVRRVRHPDPMDDDARADAEVRLAHLEVVLTALARRHEVVDVIWTSSTVDEAEQRLRSLLAVPTSVTPRFVLELQLRRLAGEERERLTAEVETLRRSLA